MGGAVADEVGAGEARTFGSTHTEPSENNTRLIEHCTAPRPGQLSVSDQWFPLIVVAAANCPVAFANRLSKTEPNTLES